MVKSTKGLEERRQAIITTARELFQAEDYDTITMQQIVDTLGIAKGTIFYYFASKEELLKAVVENIMQEDIARKKLVIEKTQGNALDKMRAVIELDPVAKTRKTLLDNLHKPSNAGMHTQLLAISLLHEAQLYEQLISQGCKEGIFKTDTPLECAEFILSAVQFLTDIGIYPWTNADLVRRAKAFPALIEATLKAKSGSFQFMLNRI